MDIKVSSRTDAEQEKLSPSDFRRQMKQIKEDFRNQTEELRAQLTESLSNILLGEKIPLNVTNSETGDVIIPSNRKITKTLLRRLASVHRYIEIPPSPVRIKVFEIIESYESKFNDLEDDRDRKIEAIEQGDSIDQGESRTCASSSPRSKRCVLATRWPVAMETREWSPKSSQKKTCPSFPMERPSKSV